MKKGLLDLNLDFFIPPALILFNPGGTVLYISGTSYGRSRKVERLIC
jgi:hypothetical protein